MSDVVACDICGRRDESVLVERNGHQVRFPPQGWFRITVIAPRTSAPHEVASKNACSKSCFQQLASALVEATLPKGMLAAIKEAVLGSLPKDKQREEVN